EVSRIVRDTKTARALKRLYEGQCQLCGEQLEISPGEYYLEAHHLQPLGKPHNGPDRQENIICFCPNCYALLDFGARSLAGMAFKTSRHVIDLEFIEYHDAHCR